MRSAILSHRDLNVFKAAMGLQKKVFAITLRFPDHELFCLTRQARNASRSVAASIAEAWRKRRYKRHWVSKLTDAEQEAAETQVWVEVACDCGYITNAEFEELFADAERILKQLVTMEIQADKWVVRATMMR
jgi:four helix bundle protein